MPGQSSEGGQYEMYKKYTERFFTWLGKEAPPPSRTVPDMLKACARVRRNRVAAQVIADLDACIRVRLEVNQWYFSRGKAEERIGNRSHSHFIDALRAAKKILSPLAAKSKKTTKAADSEGDRTCDVPTNQFAALVTEDPEEKHLVDKVDVDEPHDKLLGKTVCVKANQKCGLVTFYNKDAREYDVLFDSSTGTYHEDQLVELDKNNAQTATDGDLFGETCSFAAACFLYDLERALQQIETAWDDFKNHRVSILCATALTNMCIQQVERLSSELQLIFPNLESLERIFAAVYLERSIGDIVSQMGMDYDKALALASDIAFGPENMTILGSVTDTDAPWQGLPNCHVSLLLYLIPGLEKFEDMVGGDRRILPQTRTHVAKSLRGKDTQQIDSVIQCVVSNAMDSIVGESLIDANDCFFGQSALLPTASFVRGMTAAGFITKKQKVWQQPRIGIFGPVWDERHAPAKSTSQLRDYLGSSLPALLFFAGPHEHCTEMMREFLFDRHAPLWPLLTKAMNKGKHTLPMVVALHAYLLSVVKVNSRDLLCTQLKGTLKDTLERTLAQYKVCQPRIAHPLLQGNLAVMIQWLEHKLKLVNPRANPIVEGSNPDGGSTREGAARQIDHAVLMNPWLVGQQLLSVAMGPGLLGGSNLMDADGICRIVLHIYNALRQKAGLEAIPLLETLMKALGPGPVLWFGGRPTRNFTKNYFHSVGLAVGMKKNRKLAEIKPEHISAAYRRAALNDFSDILQGGGGESVDPLPVVIKATRKVFATDPLVGLNMAAYGACLFPVMDRVIAAFLGTVPTVSTVPDADAPEDTSADPPAPRPQTAPGRSKKLNAKAKSKAKKAEKQAQTARADDLTSARNRTIEKLLMMCDCRTGMDGGAGSSSNNEVPDRLNPSKFDFSQLPPLEQRQQELLVAAGRALAQGCAAIKEEEYVILRA